MKFSVIVPVYNVAPYLPECIDSILSQSFEDFELVLVVDGSPDDSLFICREYEAKDGRVKTIYKENSGLVSARKAGAEVAVGEYVICIDGDDWIEEGYFERLNDIILQFVPDMLVFGYLKNTNGRKEKQSFTMPVGFFKSDGREQLIQKYLFDESGRRLNDGTIPYSLWSKAIRRELYIKAQLQVPDAITIGEDALCTAYILNDIKSVFAEDRCFYNYRILPESISHTFSTRIFDKFLLVADEFMKIPYIDRNKIYGYCMNSLYKRLSAFSQSASYREFHTYLTNDEAYKRFWSFASKFNDQNLNLKNKFKCFLVKRRLYALIYLLHARRKGDNGG